jgi:hypothetical protein
MAFAGTTTEAVKEFYHAAGKTRIRLVAGFENDELSYWAVEEKQGDNPLDLSYMLASNVFGPKQYDFASERFKEVVNKYL